jgi:hypothetical protein
MSQDLPPETERAIFITIPLKDIIPFNGYLALWSFKAYWFYYYCLVRSNFIQIRVGNIFETLMMIPKAFVYAQYMVSYNLKKHRITALRAYRMLIGDELNYDIV